MRNFGWFVSTFIALFCAGCSAYQNPLLSSGPYPRVEDCAVIQQATPTKYVCDGKNYTSVQLADIRDGKNPNSDAVKSSGTAPSNLPSATPAVPRNNP